MFRKTAIVLLATGILAGATATSQATVSLPAMPAASPVLDTGFDDAEPNRRWRGNFYVHVDFGGRGRDRGYGRGRGHDRYDRGGYSRAHYRWCADRYRSYDARTNTYQPYHGPRRRCVSPYS